jgi:hypothetical protein
LLAPSVGVTARAEYTHQGRIHGEYDGPHDDMMPPDFPANFGGDLLIGAVGLNWKPAVGMERGPQLGIEVGLPLYQRVNGVQLPPKPRWEFARTAELWGTSETMAFIEIAIDTVFELFADTPPIIIGDISGENGGKL